MTWRTVARRDLRTFAADNTLTLFVGFFALLAAAVSYGSTRSPAPAPITNALSLLFLFAVPLTAATLVHEAVPNAVQSGRVRLTLSLPHTRTAFLAGVGAARLATVLAAVGASIVAGVAVHLLRGGPVVFANVVANVAVAALLGAAFVGVTLALTVRSSSATFAAVAAYGFFLLSFLWPAVVGVGTVLLGANGVLLAPGTADTVIQLSPVYAYQNALDAVGVSTNGPTGLIPEWGGALVLLAWAVAGFALAAHRFGARDI